MSVRAPRQQSGDVGFVGTNQSTARLLQQPGVVSGATAPPVGPTQLDLPSGPPPETSMDVGGDNPPDDPNDTGDGAQIPIPRWIADSSLLQQVVPNVPPTDWVCFFEPLRLCSRGVLKNGFCEFHSEYMFNSTLAQSATLTRDNNEKLKYTRMYRKLIKWPTQFVPMLLRVMPILELCQDINDFEDNLRLDLFAYMLRLRERNVDTIDEIVSLHKAYLVRVVRLFAAGCNTQHRPNDDAVIAHNTSVWLRNNSYELSKHPYEGKLVLVTQSDGGNGGARDENSTQLGWLHLNSCSVFTQMVALMYEHSYVQSPSLNFEWLTSPSAFTIYDGKNLILDCTKASHGTAANEPLPIIGDPATLSYFRTDGHENIVLLHENYTPNKLICLASNIDRNTLIGRRGVATLADGGEEGNNGTAGNV